jgi:hypothetical protein
VSSGNRIGPPSLGSERDMLRGFPDDHRAILAMKGDGLTDAKLRQQPAPDPGTPEGNLGRCGVVVTVTGTRSPERSPRA